MAKNRTGRTPTWAIMAGKPESVLPPKSKGKVERITRFELWAGGKKVGSWNTLGDRQAERKAKQALMKLPDNTFYRLIEISKWTDNRERSITINSGFRER
jgi:hypothetical protein